MFIIRDSAKAFCLRQTKPPANAGGNLKERHKAEAFDAFNGFDPVESSVRESFALIDVRACAFRVGDRTTG